MSTAGNMNTQTTVLQHTVRTNWHKLLHKIMTTASIQRVCCSVL